MAEINIETISAIALGISLSACTGFRVFIPLLVAGIASHFGILPLGSGFEWMGSIPALICFSVAAIVEILAYYIPIVDNLLDTIAIPLSVVAGTLLMTSVVPADSEWMKWGMGIIVGGGSAATIQSGSTLVRFLSTGFTGGTANPAISTGEGVAATSFSILSLFIPILIAIVILIIITVILRQSYKKWKKGKEKLYRAVLFLCFDATPDSHSCGRIGSSTCKHCLHGICRIRFGNRAGVLVVIINSSGINYNKFTSTLIFQ